MVRKNFYIRNKRALDKLKSVDNQSRYVTQLILDDVNGKGGDKGIDKVAIFEAIKSYFEGNKSLNTDKKPAKDSQEIQQSINQILGM